MTAERIDSATRRQLRQACEAVETVYSETRVVGGLEPGARPK